MPNKITAIRVQEQRRDRASIYLDGEYAFGLQLVLAAGLHIGQELSADQIAALKQRDEGERAYEATLHYLTYRPRSRREIEQYLSKRQVPEAQAAEVMARLERARLVDDAAFARSFVESRAATRPKSRLALTQELRAKGVADEEFVEAIEQVDGQEGVRQVAQQYARRYARLDEATFRRRMLGALQRRGYAYATAAAVAAETWQRLQHPTQGDTVDEDSPGDEDVVARSYRCRKET